MAPVVPSRNRGACTHPDLADKLFETADLGPAERTQLRRHVEACPMCGPNQQLIEQAEAWLSSRLPRQRAVEFGTCPPAEDLYDFGRGPGAPRLATQRRAEIKEHVARCSRCAETLTTLSARPPLPLVLDSPQESESLGNPTPRPGRGFGARAWIGWAAAALVLTSAGVFWDQIKADGPRDETLAASISYPAPSVLRGTSARALSFPRDRVLAGASHGLWHPLRFELAEREEASLYRVFLMRNDGGAFDRGRTVAALASSSSVLTLANEIGGATIEFTPGTYTWEGWAKVRELEIFLGRRDFEVAPDSALQNELDQLAPLDEPRRSSEILALLHQRGFWTDARAYARSLPQTPERDAYLAHLPGR